MDAWENTTCGQHSMIPTTMVMSLPSQLGKNAPEGQSFLAFSVDGNLQVKKGPRAKYVALRCPLVSNWAPAWTAPGLCRKWSRNFLNPTSVQDGVGKNWHFLPRCLWKSQLPVQWEISTPLLSHIPSDTLHLNLLAECHWRQTKRTVLHPWLPDPHQQGKSVLIVKCYVLITKI